MNKLPRRAVLRGATLSTVAAAGVIGSSTQMQAADPARAAAGATRFASDRRMLAALQTPTVGEIVFLSEPGREGPFVCRAGRLPDDPLQGLFVPSSTAGLYYERVWDRVHGRPEWFGAQVNNGRADCAAAIEACYAFCPVTQFGQADYFVRRTLRFHLGYRTVQGLSIQSNEQGQGTRIILQGSAPGVHTDDIMIVGSPRGTNADVPQQVHFSNFTLVRDGAATPHRSGDITRYPTGLRIAYVVHATFRGIASLESSVGFYIGGVVYTKFDDCISVRTRPGTTSANDLMVGYYLDGQQSFGYAGGNASIYLNRCLAAEQHPSHVNPMGLCGRGAFVDTFLDNFESARIATGISFDAAGARALGQTVDLHIRNPILDGCSRFGIDINLDQTSSASIEIIDPYIYAAGGGGDRGILIHDGAGLATLTGGQVHGDFAGGSLWFTRTRGVRVQGVKIHQASRPVVVGEASNLVLEPQINNFNKASGNFAITCDTLVRSVVRAVIMGAAGPSFAGGVSLGPRSVYCQVDGTGIDPGCFTGGSPANKVWFNGADARGGIGGAAFLRSGNVLAGVTA